MFSAVRWIDSQTHMSDDATVREVWKISDHSKKRYPGRIRALFALVREFVTDLGHILMNLLGWPIPEELAPARIEPPARIGVPHPTVRALLPAYLLTTVHSTAPPLGSSKPSGHVFLT